MDILPVVLICFILFGIGLKVAAHLDSPNRRWRRIARAYPPPTHHSPPPLDIIFSTPTVYSTPPHPNFDEWIKESIEDDIASSDDVRAKIKMQKETIKLLRIKLSNVSVRHSDLIRDLMRENQELWDQKLRDSEELIRLKQAMIEEKE